MSRGKHGQETLISPINIGFVMQARDMDHSYSPSRLVSSPLLSSIELGIGVDFSICYFSFISLL
jgi:hypothetical protein